MRRQNFSKLGESSILSWHDDISPAPRGGRTETLRDAEFAIWRQRPHQSDPSLGMRNQERCGKRWVKSQPGFFSKRCGHLTERVQNEPSGRG